MRWLLLVALLATACVHHPNHGLERQRAATRAAKSSSVLAQARRERARREWKGNDRYREEKKAAMLTSMRDAPRAASVILAVFDVEDHDAILDARDRRELSAYFATAMLEGTRNRIVPPDRIRAALLDAKTRSYRACYDETCRIELGRRVAADHTLEPGLFRHEDGCQLGATVYDLTTETTIWASSTTSSCDLMSLFMATESLARSLAEREKVLR